MRTGNEKIRNSHIDTKQKMCTLGTARHGTALTSFFSFSGKLQNFSDKLFKLGINNRHAEKLSRLQFLRGVFLYTNFFHKGEILSHEVQAH